MSTLSELHFHNEEAAYARLESIVWPAGPVCPHCGNADAGRMTKLAGESTRMGLRACGECRTQFRVTIGTLFEKSKVPLHKWFQAAYFLASSKKGISSHQLHRTLHVSYKTAWFMSHCLREAMRNGSLAPMGGKGMIVEIDETFIGNKTDMPKRRGFAHKHAVLSLVERGGKVRSFHVAGTSAAQLVPILRANIAKETAIMTDEAGQYAHLGKEFASHEYVNHSAGEYGRGDVHTNTLEGFHSIFKRGMKGVYQHCSKQHLHRYVAEFDFRYNNRVRLGIDDAERTMVALRGIVGKRLTYRDSSAAALR